MRTRDLPNINQDYSLEAIEIASFTTIVDTAFIHLVSAQIHGFPEVISVSSDQVWEPKCKKLMSVGLQLVMREYITSQNILYSYYFLTFLLRWSYSS